MLLTPPKMPFEFTVFDRDANAPGGARPPTEQQQHQLAAPQLSPHLQDAADVVAPEKSPDWVSRYLAAHWPDLQFMTGECVHCVAVHITLATALHKQGVVLPHPSVGFSYYTTTGDASFSIGSWLSAALPRWQSIGNCTNALYSQEWVISHWQGGGDYPAEFLPQPPAYADAPKCKIVRWSQVCWTNPDINQLKLLLNAGYSIGFQIGNHEITIDMYDGWWFFGFDSEMVVDQTGKGIGVRAFGTDLVQRGFGFCIVEEVDVTGGAGLGTFIIPSDMNFGDVPINTTVRRTGTLRNETGGVVSFATSINHPAFVGGVSGITASNSPIPIDIDFTPTVAGAISGVVTVTSNAPGSPQHFGLVGVGIAPSQPPPGQQMAIDDCKAKSTLVKTDSDGLVVNQVTQAILDKGRVDAAAALGAWNALVVDAGGGPPSNVTYLTVGTSLTDRRGLVWAFGAYVSPRYGYTLLCNDRGLASSPEVALVAGEIKMRIEANKPAWQMFVGNDAYDNRWVPTTAP